MANRLLLSSVLAVAAGCATSKSTPSAPPPPAYRITAPAAGNPFAEGQCSVEYLGINGPREPSGTPLPAWAEASFKNHWSSIEFRPRDYADFVSTATSRLSSFFSSVSTEELLALRRLAGTAPSAGVGMARDDDARRAYFLIGKVTAFRPPVESPPQPLRMTVRLDVTGPIVGEQRTTFESTEFDLKSADTDADFGALGDQLARAFTPYLRDRLGCWVHRQ